MDVIFHGQTDKRITSIDVALKHGKDVDIDHFHVYLAHAHASVLKATAKQHWIRFTGELV